MKAIVRGFAVIVRRSPLVVVLATLVVAGFLGSFARQVEVATGNEGFAPDNPEIEALEQIGRLFDSDQASVFQVVVRDPGGDVISAEGLRVVQAVEETIRRVAGDRLAATPDRPGVVSYLAPATGAAQARGIPVESLDDSTVDRLYRGALEQIPPERAGFLTGLLAEGAEGAGAEAGLVLAFLEGGRSGGSGDFDAQIALEEDIATALEGIQTDLALRSFSTTLLFGEVDAFTSEVGRLFAYAGAIIVVILLFVYWLRPRGVGAVRSARRTVVDMAMTLATILLAIGMMQGSGVLLEKVGVISAFSAPTQVVPILIIGLGVDYAIHLISRYREEVGEGMTVDDSMTLSLETSGVALVLATVTTAIGFLTNLANPVPALTDFGILAALGILFSFLLMMTFVPAVRVLLDRRAEAGGRLPVEAMAFHGQRILPRLMGRTAVVAERVPYLALAVALVLGGLGYYGFTQLETRFSFTDFLPEDAPAVETMEILERDFGGGFGEQSQVLVTAPEGGGDLAQGTFWNQMVDAHAALGEVEWVFTFDTETMSIPDADSPVSVLQQFFAEGPGSAPPGVSTAVQQVGMGPDLHVPDDADLSPLYEAMAEEAPERLSGVAHFQGERLAAALFDIRTSAGETEVDELRQALDEVFAPLEVADADAIATSQNIVSDVVVNELTASQSWSLFLTLAAAGLVLVVYFLVWNRRPFLGVITILPVVLVVMWTYGLMYLTGIPFGPVTATLAALAIGIGVPYTIHLARRFEEDRTEMEDLEEAIRSTTTHTGGALAGSAFTTMAGFGILVTSSLVPFRQMGQVTVFAIGLALIASILVLPSMLVLGERWHRRVR